MEYFGCNVCVSAQQLLYSGCTWWDDGARSGGLQEYNLRKMPNAVNQILSSLRGAFFNNVSPEDYGLRKIISYAFWLANDLKASFYKTCQ